MRDVAPRHVHTRADDVVRGEKDDKAAVEKKKRRVATSAPLLWPPPRSDAPTFMCEQPPPVHAAAARAAAAVCPRRADIECPTELTPRTATAAANLRKVNCLVLGTDVSTRTSARGHSIVQSYIRTRHELAPVGCSPSCALVPARCPNPPAPILAKKKRNHNQPKTS